MSQPPDDPRFLDHHAGRGHPERPERLAATMSHLEAQTWFQDLIRVAPAPLDRESVGRFDFAAGGIRCPDCSEDAAGPRLGPVARGQLTTFLGGEVPDGLDHPRRHLGLLSDFIAYHVVSRPLKSFRFLGGLLPSDAEVPGA